MAEDSTPSQVRDVEVLVENPDVDSELDDSDRKSFTDRRPERQSSIMREVQDRIEMLQEVSPFSRVAHKDPNSFSERKLSRAARAALTAPSLAEVEARGTDMRQPRCRITFFWLLAITMVLVMIISASSMFVPLEMYRQDLKNELEQKAQSNTEALRETVKSLANNEAIEEVSSSMEIIRDLIEEELKGPLNTTLSNVFEYLRTVREGQAPGSNLSDEELTALANRTLNLMELDEWRSASIHTHSLWLNVSFESGQRVDTVAMPPDGPNETSKVASVNVWQEAARQSVQGNGTLVSSKLFEPVDGGKDRACRGSSPMDNSKFYYVLADEGKVSSLPDCEAQCVAKIGCKGVEYAWRADRCELWTRPGGIGSSFENEDHVCFRLAQGSTGYTIQKAQVSRNPEAAPQYMWSELWNVDDKPRIANTVPMAYCGNYSCFDGVISVTAALTYLSDLCNQQWEALASSLRTRSPVSLDAASSTVFVIVAKSRFPEQQGIMVGSAHYTPEGLVFASEAQQSIVNATAFALKERFGRWDSNELHRSRFFSFGLQEASNPEEPLYESCDSELAVRHNDTNCMKVGTVPVSLDSHTRWLVVMVLPVVTYSIPQADKEKLAENADIQVEALRVQISQLGAAYKQGIALIPLVSMVSVLLALGLGCLMSYPLRQLDSNMQELAHFNAKDKSSQGEHVSYKRQLQRRSNIVEVSNLQRTFARLSAGIEAFTRFVPETVVRRIVRGDPRAARLHVTRREVTIMFSDIKDFTAISESLSEKDLLFLLTRYLSVMTRLVEDFGGVVTEVLGDGLLAFWNTPDDVKDHAAMACDAALAQQQAIVFLNDEFSHLNLPPLQIRIGLHTGSVLSGNIGSEMKMKFGCLGDPINLASRLEGLCKFYGVGIICSSATRNALPPSYIFCRKLDLVQVKGRREATLIFEVVGHDKESKQGDGSEPNSQGAGVQSHPCSRSSTFESAKSAVHRSTLSLCKSASVLCLDGPPQHTVSISGSEDEDTVSSEVRAQTELYERALEAWQTGRFTTACMLAEELLRTSPDNLAGQRLLERSKPLVNENGVSGLAKEELAAWTGVFVMTEKE
eukprot:TRINITY_DN48856_c0_g1_i1.p1 TRINITY_DN48856_c0_g1~~TRINITY_DN48856_c0_g1_i1.p1  ORF type:complete len:1097 (+),score=214.49 TRINITY_DN48856_c0_g1_i1:48-3293(+)